MREVATPRDCPANGPVQKALAWQTNNVMFFFVMKNIPYVYLFCVAAFLGLPLASVAAPASLEEKIPASVLEKYDANKDGALDEAEKAAWQADREKQQAAREARRAGELARYDADKDGKLSRDERATMKTDVKNARAEKRAAREADKARKAAAAEAKKLAKYDKNQNGKLDDDELAALKAATEKRQAAAEKRKATIAAGKSAQESPADGEPTPDQD